MITFADAATAFPTAVLTVLLGVVLVYWVLALIGLVDFESGGISLDVDLDGGLDNVGVVAGYLVAIGLNGVPFSVVVSLIVLVSWTLCCMAAMWLLPLIPTATLGVIAGAAALLVSVALSLPLTAAALRPLRGLFVTHSARSNAGLIGERCKVLSQSVDEEFGRAEVSTRGAGLNLKVWAKTPNRLSRGSIARILEYDQSGGRYLIAEDTED